MLALRYKKVELNKFFDVFRENLINYTIKELNNTEYVIVIIQDLMDPKASFDAINEPKYLTPYDSKSEAKKAIPDSILRQYTEREAIFVSNMNNIYGIIWGKCTLGLQSFTSKTEKLFI